MIIIYINVVNYYYNNFNLNYSLLINDYKSTKINIIKLT